MGVFHHFGDPVGPAIPRAREDREGRKLRVCENSSSQETGKNPGQALRRAGALAGWCGPRNMQRVLVYRAPRVPWRSPAWAWSSHRPHSLPWHAQAVQVPALGSSVRATRPALGHTDLPLGASFMVCVMRVSTFIGTLLKKSPRFGGHYWLSFFCFMNGGCGDQWR